MIDLSDCSVLGTIAKTHGTRGQLIVRLSNLDTENIKEMETVFIEINGLPVPFFISEYDEKNPNTLVLTIADLVTEDQAHELIGCRIFIKTSSLIPAPGYSMKTEIEPGYEVFDVIYGRLGILVELIDIHQNPLLRILHDNKEILVPFQDEFIQKIDKAKKRITLNTPPGLIDLN